MNKVGVISLEKVSEAIEKNVKSIAGKTLKILKKDKVSVDVYLIDGKRMRFLNKKFRGQDKTTTVLSFEEPRNFILPPSKFRKIGEIYLNMTNNQRPITNDGRKLSVVGRKLLVHGILHLLGYNHKKKNDRIRMEQQEQKVLSQILNLD